MQSLNALVLAGKVLYLGISDTPAWVVSQANQYARDHGMRTFSVYQDDWSAAKRDFERDIIPMTVHKGMALAPWGALGRGKFVSEEQRGKNTAGRRMGDASEVEIMVSKVLEKVAKAKKCIITSVALACVMHKTPYVFPIVGGRTIEHLKGNIEALKLQLSDANIEEIDVASGFDIGFPLAMLGGGNPSDLWLMNIAGNFDYVDWMKPLSPRAGQKN